MLEKESPPPELREQVEGLDLRALPRFQFDIDRHRAGRTKAAAGDMYGIEIQVAKYTGHLDAVYSQYRGHIQQMEKIGMDVNAPREDLARSLEDRTDALSGRIDLALSRTAHFKDRLSAIPVDADAAKLLAAANKSLGTNTASMEAMLDLMDVMELDTQSHREALTAITQDQSKG